MRFILNLPWTVLGLLGAIVSIPISARLEQSVLIITVRSWWWTKSFRYLKGVRGVASGNIVLLGPNQLPNDLEHELVHIEQFERYPFIFPFLNVIEYLRHGYRQNRFEDEAYARAGNVYKGH